MELLKLQAKNSLEASVSRLSRSFFIMRLAGIEPAAYRLGGDKNVC